MRIQRIKSKPLSQEEKNEKKQILDNVRETILKEIYDTILHDPELFPTELYNHALKYGFTAEENAAFEAKQNKIAAETKKLGDYVYLSENKNDSKGGKRRRTYKKRRRTYKKRRRTYKKRRRTYKN